MFLHKREVLITKISDDPECGCGNGHSTSANLRRINLRDDDPTGDPVTEGVTGHESHNKNQDCHAATMDVIQPAHHGEGHGLYQSAGEDQLLASREIHKPQSKQGED